MTNKQRTLAFLRRNCVGVAYLMAFTAALVYALYIMATREELDAVAGVIGPFVLAAPWSFLDLPSVFSEGLWIVAWTLEALLNAVLLNWIARTLTARVRQYRQTRRHDRDGTGLVL